MNQLELYSVEDEIITLKWSNYTGPEISELLDKPEHTVRNILWRKQKK